MRATVVILIVGFLALVAVWPGFGQNWNGNGYGQSNNNGYSYPAQSYQQGCNNYGGAASGGRFPSTSLNNILDQVDQKSWQNVPVARSPGGMPAQGSFSGQSAGFMPGQGGAGGYQNAGAYGNRMPMGMNSGMGAMGQNRGMPMISGANGFVPPTNGFAPFGGMRQPLQSGAPFSKQNLLRIFLGGGTGGTGGFGGSSSSNSPEKQAHDSSVTGQAEALLQRANDQAAQAESDAARASYGDDKGARQSAASSARYHANDANEAADTAASITYGQSQYAQDYAAQARNAANRAQEAADRAQYNASQ